jgi:hypothetical protein
MCAERVDVAHRKAMMARWRASVYGHTVGDTAMPSTSTMPRRASQNCADFVRFDVPCAILADELVIELLSCIITAKLNAVVAVDIREPMTEV